MRTFKFIGALTLCAATVCSLWSCGDDNEDEPSYPIINVEGSRISSINGFKISYDETGRVDMIVNPKSGEQLTINYKKKTMQFSDIRNISEGITLDFSYNHKGYIKEISCAWDYYDPEDNDHEKGSGICQYSYDDRGHLIYVLAVSNNTETDLTSGTISKSREDAAWHLDWTGGNLSAIDIDGTDTENGITETIKTVVTVDYGQTSNEHAQLPISLASVMMPGMFIDDDIMSILAAVGLFGAGPAMLPARITEKPANEPTDSFSVSFQLNSNGTIAEERVAGDEIYRFSYTK